MSSEVAEKSHAVLGPSGWHTWSACPGSVPLSEGIPNTSSKYAREGTAAHALLEDCLTDGTDPEDRIGQDYIVEGEAFIVDQEMADAVNSAIDIARTYMDDGAILQVEQTVPLAFMTGEEGAEGTCDISIIREHGTHLVIADFKYGKGVQVYASEYLDEKDAAAGRAPPNGQLAMYALGWLQKHGFLYEDVEKITLVVIQPRIEWTDEFTLTIEELRNFEQEVRDAAGRVELNRQAAAEEALLDLNPGEKQCKFCNAKAICPALRNAVSTSLATIAQPSDVAEFEDLSLPKKAAAIAVNENASSEKLAEFMRAIPLIEAACTAVRAEVERRLFDGQQVPGYYLGVGRAGHRQWQDPDTALKELTKSGRLKVAEATTAKVISPTQAEKKLKDRPKIWSKIAPLIVKPEGGPSVCKEGDKNPPYAIASPAESFENLDAQPTLSLADMMD